MTPGRRFVEARGRVSLVDRVYDPELNLTYWGRRKRRAGLDPQASVQAITFSRVPWLRWMPNGEAQIAFPVHAERRVGISMPYQNAGSCGY